MKYIYRSISRYHIVLILFFIAACSNVESTSVGDSQTVKPPFAMQELMTAPDVPIPPVETLKASDGIPLAYRAYIPEHPEAGLILYHGGGAHSAAGYQHIGSALSEKYNVAVFTPDIRGHGRSDGPRGDAPASEQVLQDVRSLVRLIASKRPDIPLFLGGHSSGAGLILNYTSSAYEVEVSGYVFVAPHLGFRSGTAREDTPDTFTEVNTFAFVVNGITQGVLFGHKKAVRFNYPAEVLESDSGLVGYNTVNMANALTPTAPDEQLSRITQPLGVWIGEDDELLDAKKVVSFVKSSNSAAYIETVEGEEHLSVLLAAADLIGPWIQARIGE